MIFDGIMLFFGYFIIFYMLLVTGSYLAMSLFALFQLRKQRGLDRSEFENTHIQSIYSKPVSVLVPAYNEEMGVIESIYSLLSLIYPEYEIIVINDGSTDDTEQRVIDQFAMKPIDRIIKNSIQTKEIISTYQSTIHSNLYLVNKVNGGKADALNVGINFSSYPYFCSIDGDSILEPKSLLRVMKPILRSGEKVIACGGNVRIVNNYVVKQGAVYDNTLSSNPIVLMQIIEYLRAFLLGRIALSHFNLVLIISGAFSVFQKKYAIQVNGYSPEMIGEDMELVVKLHRYIKNQDEDKRIEFVADPVCYTEAPQDLKILRRQRRRWHQGLISSLWKHRGMTLNPKYGKIGLLSFPYFWIIECLGPIVELCGYIYVIVAFFAGQVYLEFAIILILLFVIFGTILSIMSILFEAWSLDSYPRNRDILRLIALSFTETLWYRPLTLIWRLEGIIHFLLGKKVWGDMQRVGTKREGEKTI